jgi:hypothetical protein
MGPVVEGPTKMVGRIGVLLLKEDISHVQSECFSRLFFKKVKAWAYARWFAFACGADAHKRRQILR